MYEFIQISVENGVGRILLNDPPKRNALSQPMARELNEALEAFRFDPAVRVVLLRGANGYFCAGGDVQGMKRRVDAFAQGLRPETDTRANMANLNRLVLTIRQMEKPVVSWIEGACAGGGVSLAMASDFSIAEEGCKMTCAFTGVGLAPDMGSTLLMTCRVGPARATDLFMTGRRFTAEDAEQWNLITRAVPADELEAAVEKQVAQLAAGPTCSYAEIKAAINRIVYPDLYQVMASEADCAERLTHTADHAEAVNAFLEKRRPVFSGK